MNLAKIKYQSRESDPTDDIAERRVSYKHGDYEDVIDFDEMSLYHELLQQETISNI